MLIRCRYVGIGFLYGVLAEGWPLIVSLHPTLILTIDLTLTLGRYVGIGFLYGVLAEGWPVFTALEFAVTSVSTGNVRRAPTLPRTANET